MRTRALPLLVLCCSAALAWWLLSGQAGPRRAAGPESLAQGPETVSRDAYPGPVADAAGVLGGFQGTLEGQAKGWLDDLGVEIHVVTLRHPGVDTEAPATAVFEKRRIGESAPSGGILVMLNAERGEARITVSYGLEGAFPDAHLGRVAEDQLAPYAAYRLAGMASMDVLAQLKDFAFLRAAGGALELAPEYRERPGFREKARYLSGGAGAQAKLSAAELLDRDFKAPVSAQRRAAYAPSRDPMESALAYLRSLRDLVGDPTLGLLTPGSRCMRDRYPYAPFEQLERLERAEASKPWRLLVEGDRAALDGERPAHGFVPILLERSDGLWRVDLVEVWKNLFFTRTGEYRQQNTNHSYAFGLARFGSAPAHDVAAWELGGRDPMQLLAELAGGDGIHAEYVRGEVLYRNCWLPLEALAHYERAVRLSPGNRFFERLLGDRASYIGFHDLAAAAYARLDPYGRLALARALRDAGDLEAAVVATERALERNPFDLEALALLGTLHAQRDKELEAAAVEARIAALRADSKRPFAPVVASFSPASPALDTVSPTRVGEQLVYDHSRFSVTLHNTSGRAVEIERVLAHTDGTPDRSGLGDIADYWRYPSGPRRLEAGEAVRLDKTWGFTVDTPNVLVRHTFDVCWRAGGERQCADYALDTFSREQPAPRASSPASTAPASARSSAPVRLALEFAPHLAVRLELVDLLYGRRFDELSRRVRAEEQAFESDRAREARAFQTWDAFAVADPALTPLLDEWVREDGSWVSHAARGVHHRRSGWQARGKKLSSKTSRQQFASMREHYDRAEHDLRRALELNPRLVVAHRELIAIGSARPMDTGALLDRAVSVCPSCVEPRWALLAGLVPRWGGSFEEMEAFVAAQEPAMRRHPGLRALRGALAWERGFLARKDHAEAVREYDAAMRHGDYWMFRRYRGEALHRLGRYDEALADLDAWVAHGQRIPRALRRRAFTLWKLGRAEEAWASAALARRLDPADPDIEELAAWFDRELGTPDAGS